MRYYIADQNIIPARRNSAPKTKIQNKIDLPIIGSV